MDREAEKAMDGLIRDRVGGVGEHVMPGEAEAAPGHP
jgi:hypothetical protein